MRPVKPGTAPAGEAGTASRAAPAAVAKVAVAMRRTVGWSMGPRYRRAPLSVTGWCWCATVGTLTKPTQETD
ncbi:hypothetical protein nbrc107697_20990 [Gordonia crocea]|uniref:Uncharacterized protein n=1 Tax=Gordonia crocea TaxID=589162 RepID=A0A7I9UZ28_9ACTN|nr:hypothetical protein nbrc107697_20990 [Gordonia crocea]